MGAVPLERLFFVRGGAVRTLPYLAGYFSRTCSRGGLPGKNAWFAGGRPPLPSLCGRWRSRAPSSSHSMNLNHADVCRLSCCRYRCRRFRKRLFGLALLPLAQKTVAGGIKQGTLVRPELYFWRGFRFLL